MKHVLVTSDYFENAPYILLNDLYDLMEYGEMIKDSTTESVNKLIKSDVPWDRFNHFVDTSNPGDNTLFSSYLSCKVSGGNPILQVGDFIDSKIRTMANYINRGETVLVNPKGGWCPPSSDWIITEVDSPIEPVNVVIADTPSLINLENDPELEEHTLNYFKDNDLELSYVVRLRSYDKATLTTIFKEFKAKGGYGLYVYTTGIDIPQMYDYCEAAVAAELVTIKFDFNAGFNDDHKDVIAEYEGQIQFEVLLL
jgi:hypothetical protein